MSLFPENISGVCADEAFPVILGPYHNVDYHNQGDREEQGMLLGPREMSVFMVCCQDGGT